jgi:hypothetical protein
MVRVTPQPRFTPGERTPGTHCTGGWVDPRAGLDREATGKILSPLPGIEPRSPGRPVRSQTLYRLSYPGSLCNIRGKQFHWHIRDYQLLSDSDASIYIYLHLQWPVDEENGYATECYKFVGETLTQGKYLRNFLLFFFNTRRRNVVEHLLH